jgi:hypothetical protein
MATRKIIDIEQNGEKVWPKGHASATYMSNGTTVEDAINSIQTGTGGGIVSETDPIFSASPAASITEAKKTEWDNKMDKVTLATVATTGSYNDLKDKPNFDANVYVWNWDGTQTGLIAQEEYNSIANADYIIVRVTDEEDITREGTFQLIKYTDCVDAINHTLIGGIATELAIRFTNNLQYGITSTSSYVIPENTSQLNNDSNFVSSTNLKTINGESIVGSGDIAVSGGAGKKIRTYDDTSITLGESPVFDNTIYVYSEPITNIMLGGMGGNFAFETSRDYGEALILFTTGSDATFWCTEVMLWPNGTFPTPEPNTAYELSITATKVGGDYIYKAVLTPFKPV